MSDLHRVPRHRSSTAREPRSRADRTDAARRTGLPQLAAAAERTGGPGLQCLRHRRRRSRCGQEVQRRAGARHDRFPGPRRCPARESKVVRAAGIRWRGRPRFPRNRRTLQALRLHQARRRPHLSEGRHRRPGRRRQLRFRAEAAQHQHRPVRKILETQPRQLPAGSLPQRRQIPVAARPGLGDRAGHLVFAVRGLRSRRGRPSRGGGQVRRGRPARPGRPRAERAGIPDDPGRADRPERDPRRLAVARGIRKNGEPVQLRFAQSTGRGLPGRQDAEPDRGARDLQHHQAGGLPVPQQAAGRAVALGQPSGAENVRGPGAVTGCTPPTWTATGGTSSCWAPR